MRQRGRLIAAGLVVVVVLFVGLRQFSGDDDPEPLRSRAALVAPGDCVDIPDDDSELLEPTDCDAPHEGEVFAEFELQDGPYPGDGPVIEVADRGCIERWDGAVGTNYFTDVTFDFVTVTPDAARWDDGVREVGCVLVSAEGTPLVGSQLLE